MATKNENKNPAGAVPASATAGVRKPTLILGETVKQAYDYAKSKGMKRDEVIALHSTGQLYGVKSHKIIRVGTWYKNRFADEILWLANMRDFEIVDGDY